MPTPRSSAPHVGGDEWSVKPLHMAINGWAEEARSVVEPTLLSLGALGQNDVPELAFLAWRKAAAAARCLDGGSRRPCRLASQVLYKQERDAPGALHGLVDKVRAIVPPVDEAGAPGAECQHLYERVTQSATGQDAPFA